MKKSKEELNRIHKEKCRELKEIRAKMAEDLGIELHQRECTYEGYCRGTCPACRKEELQLNAALLKMQIEGANLKGRVAAAGLAAMTALCLTGCNTPGQNVTEGATERLDGDLAGFITPETSECDAPTLDENLVQLEGEVLSEISESLTQPSYEAPVEYVELEGDVAYLPETDNPDENTTYMQETEEPVRTE